MNHPLKKLQVFAAAALCATTLGLATMGPAKADGAASTRNIILGAAALIAGAAIEANVANKNAQANSVSGYTPDGAAVYGDGHVVMPNGQSYHPGNYGQSIACNGGQCSISGGSGYAPYATGYDEGYDNGRYGRR